MKVDILNQIDIDYYIPAPLTRDEIKTGLKQNEIPVDNELVLESFIKITRIIEDLHGITLKPDAWKNYVKRMKV